MTEDMRKKGLDPSKALERLQEVKEEVKGYDDTAEYDEARLNLVKFATACLATSLTGRANALSTTLSNEAYRVFHNVIERTPPARVHEIASCADLINSLVRLVSFWDPSEPHTTAYVSFILLNNMMDKASRFGELSWPTSPRLVDTLRRVAASKFEATFRLFAGYSQQLKSNDRQKYMVHFFWQNLFRFVAKFVHRPVAARGPPLDAEDDEPALTESDVLIFTQALEFVRMGVNGDLVKRGWDWDDCASSVTFYFQHLLENPEYAYAFYLMKGVDLFVLWLNENTGAEDSDMNCMEQNAAILSIFVEVSRMTGVHDHMVGTGGVVPAVLNFLRTYRHYVYLQAFTCKQSYKIIVTACDLLHRLLSGPSGSDCLRKFEQCGGSSVLSPYAKCQYPTDFAVTYVLELVETKQIVKKLQTLEYMKEVCNISETLAKIDLDATGPDSVAEVADDVVEVVDDVKEVVDDVKEVVDDVKEVVDDVKEVSDDVKEVSDDVKEVSDDVIDANEHRRQEARKKFLSEREALRQKQLEKRTCKGDSFLAPSPEDSSLEFWPKTARRTRKKNRRRRTIPQGVGDDTCSTPDQPPITRSRVRRAKCGTKKDTTTQVPPRGYEGDSTLVTSTEIDSLTTSPVVEIHSSEDGDNIGRVPRTRLGFANGVVGHSSPLEFAASGKNGAAKSRIRPAGKKLNVVKDGLKSHFSDEVIEILS